MYIKKITLNNFRCFSGTKELELSDKINFFVGNNNCGKTTIFKAIQFIQSAKNKEDFITKGKNDEEVSVEIELCGKDLKDFINSKNKKYQDYVIDNNDGTFSLRILRSSKEDDVNGKKFNIENIRVYHPSNELFENPTGADNTITALFDAQFVYSDLDNEEYQDFGKTKIVGKLISEVTKDFFKEEENNEKTAWGKLKEAYETAFGDEGLNKYIENLVGSVNKILAEQYGDGQLKFNFAMPGADIFLKFGQLILSDAGVDTPVEQKGTGMQRALALSLIKYYADKVNKSKGDIQKPIIFFLDEPETFLHPKAQDKLLKSLDNLSEKSQIFITTHSPYLLKNFNKDRHRLTVFNKDNGDIKIDNQEMLNLLDDFSPSVGEINYFAFGVPSVEFHIELFNKLISKRANMLKKESIPIRCMDEWLIEVDPEFKTDKDHVNRNNRHKDHVNRNRNRNNDYKDQHMSTYIRNYIHHPAEANGLKNDEKRKKPTDEEIEKSIKHMLDIYEEHFKSEQ